jgi:hypothetical protein
VALSADVACANRTSVSGPKPWQSPTAKPALKASPHPQVHFTATSKRHGKFRSVGVMIVCATLAQREDAAPGSKIEKKLRRAFEIAESA